MEIPNTRGEGQRPGHSPLGNFLLPVAFAGCGEIGRPLQCLDAQSQRLGQNQDAAQEGNSPELSGSPGTEPFLVAVDGTVGAAYRQGVVGAAPDHHALDNRLAAVGESALVVQLLLG